MNIPLSLLSLRSQTYCDYKSANTFIVISPAGHVTLFCVLTIIQVVSLIHILWKSGFPNQLQKDDDIISDSGFIIEHSLVPLGVK